MPHRRRSSRSARVSPAISVAAPAISTSSTPFSTPSKKAEEEVTMPASPVLPKMVGERVKRREDPRLIRGRATYVDDIALIGMQHMVFKRSDIAQGRI